MRLIDAEEAERLYAHMRPARQVSGGSAGNTAAGRRRARRAAPASSARSRPISWANSIATTSAAGVEFTTPASRRRRSDRPLDDPGHARRPPDDEHLPRRRPEPAGRARSTRRRSRRRAILYLEGYLWDPETPRYAMVRAIEVARGAGRKVAFTLSDIFCVDRHRDGFNELIDERQDRHPVRQRGRDPGAGRRRRTSRARSRPWRRKVETLVVTRSEDGALAIRGGERADVPAEPIEQARRHDRRRRPVRCRLPRWARRAARASRSRSSSARSRRPRSSSIMARAPRRTSGRWPESLRPSALSGLPGRSSGIGRRR